MLAALAGPASAHPGPLSADDLFEFDQDHYGGLAAVDALARRAGVRPRAAASSTCARGSAGPPGSSPAVAARAWSRSSCTPAARPGAARLNRLVGATARDGRPRRRDRAPLRPVRAFDACLSQEALLHIADKPRVLCGVPPRARSRRPDRLQRLDRLSEARRPRARAALGMDGRHHASNPRRLPRPARPRRVHVGRGGGPHRRVAADRETAARAASRAPHEDGDRPARRERATSSTSSFTRSSSGWSRRESSAAGASARLAEPRS